MDANHFQNMSDEQLIGTLESNANAARSTPGGQASVALALDEAARRLRGEGGPPKDAGWKAFNNKTVEAKEDPYRPSSPSPTRQQVGDLGGKTTESGTTITPAGGVVNTTKSMTPKDEDHT